MKPLGDVVQRFALWCHHYVDEMQLYLMLTSDPMGIVETLKQDLEEITEWRRIKTLKMNPSQSECVLILI